MSSWLLLLLLPRLTCHHRPYSPWMAASTTVAVAALIAGVIAAAGAAAVVVVVACVHAYVRHVDDDGGTSPVAQLAWAVWAAMHPCDAYAAFWA